MIQKPGLIFLMLFLPGFVAAQIHNYWSYNFNEESSLVAGAVVGGGAGASAIFYNPATISEINASKISLNASLFSFDFNSSKNILGEGIDIKSSRFFAVPRSVSYMHKPKNHPKWNLEFAFMNVANNQNTSANFTNKKTDIINNIPGEERYIAYSEMDSKLRIDYFGIGGSHVLFDNFFVGASMFLSVNSFLNKYKLDINAQPLSFNTNFDVKENSNYIASHSTQELVRFNDYRLLWKLGFLYKQPRFSVGVNITTPSLGRIYSDGKRVMNQHGQSNISNPETGNAMPDFLIIDYAEKKDVDVNFKSPFSIAAGCTYYSQDEKQVFYSTVEFFGKIDSHQIVHADSRAKPGDQVISQNTDFTEWLTFYHAAKPVLNVGVGHRWYLKKDLMLLSGFKTDFRHRKKFESNPVNPVKTLKNMDMNVFHLTSGLTLRIMGQDITAGFQYSLGMNNNNKQLVNLSNPVEFNFEELKALQGTRTFTAKSVYNSVTLLLAASFNFNNRENKK